MQETVSIVAIIGMVVSLIIALGLPIVLLIYWRKTQKANILSAGIGAVAFIIFALILEQIVHAVVLNLSGDLIRENIVIYGLYGGACAAVFEEFGRLVAMKFFMKNTLDKQNAIMYGIGHGGIEAIIIIGLSEVSNIATSLVINTVGVNTIISAVPVEQQSLVYEQVSALWETPSYAFYMGGVERISSIFLHIALSYLVYRCVKYGEKKFMALALLLHFLVDFGTVVLNSKAPIWVVEAVLAVAVAVIMAFVVRLYAQEE